MQYTPRRPITLRTRRPPHPPPQHATMLPSYFLLRACACRLTMKPMKPQYRLLCLTLAATLAACQPTETPAAKPAAPKGPPPVVVSLGKATVQPLERRAMSLAVVESVNSPQVLAEVAGRVIGVVADVGSRVKAGQPLLMLDAADLGNSLAADQADVARFKALAVQQQQNVVRYRDLLDKGFISPAKMDELVAQQHAADEQLTAAQARAANSRRAVGKTTVVAPMAGVIDARMVNIGEYVVPGKALFSLTGNGDKRVRFALSGREAAAIVPGMTVRLNRDDLQLTTQISDTRPAIDTKNGMIEALAPLPPSAAWRIGQTLTTAVVLESRPALAVPQISVVERPAGSVVYVAKDGKVKAQRVKTGIREDGKVEILSGIAEGDTVVTDGAGFLSDGAAIRPAKPAGQGKPSTASPAPATNPVPPATAAATQPPAAAATPAGAAR